MKSGQQSAIIQRSAGTWDPHARFAQMPCRTLDAIRAKADSGKTGANP
jgi:hypothetical protein